MSPDTATITVGVRRLLLDHPAWRMTPEGTAYRATRIGNALWALTSPPPAGDSGVRRVRLARLSGTSTAPHLHTIDPDTLTSAHAAADALRAAGPVTRLRNTDLWDAIATAILAQLTPTDRPRVYHALAHAHGDPVPTAAGTTALLPSPDTVLLLTDDDLRQVGAAPVGRPLRSAARAYLIHAQVWAGASPDHLLTELSKLPRVGYRTAGLAIADCTHDYSVYPLTDPALRAAAAQLTPHVNWPDTEDEFADLWTMLAGTQLSLWTLLTLAHGIPHRQFNKI